MGRRHFEKGGRKLSQTGVCEQHELTTPVPQKTTSKIHDAVNF